MNNSHDRDDSLINSHDPINPSHYKKGDVECIEAIRASLTKEAFMGYLKGSAMKYLWRYESKNGKEDIKKCLWYISLMATRYSGN